MQLFHSLFNPVNKDLHRGGSVTSCWSTAGRVNDDVSKNITRSIDLHTKNETAPKNLLLETAQESHDRLSSCEKKPHLSSHKKPIVSDHIPNRLSESFQSQQTNTNNQHVLRSASSCRNYSVAPPTGHQLRQHSESLSACSLNNNSLKRQGIMGLHPVQQGYHSGYALHPRRTQTFSDTYPIPYIPYYNSTQSYYPQQITGPSYYTPPVGHPVKKNHYSLHRNHPIPQMISENPYPFCRPVIPPYPYESNLESTHNTTPIEHIRHPFCTTTPNSKHLIPLFCGITGRDLTQYKNSIMLPKRDLGSMKVQYFDTKQFLGRGGKIQLLLRFHNIQHTYETFDMTEKTRPFIQTLQNDLISTGGSPTGQLPVLNHIGQIFCETTAIMRYIAKHLGQYGFNHYLDYLADMILDKLAYWNDDLMVAISEANINHFSRGAAMYLKSRPVYYSLFNQILHLTTGPFLTNNVNHKIAISSTDHHTLSYYPQPIWCDCALVSTLFDDMQWIAMIQKSSQLNDILILMKSESGSPISNTTQPDIGPYIFNLLKEYPRLEEYYMTITNHPLILELFAEKEIIRKKEDQQSQSSLPVSSFINDQASQWYTPHNTLSENGLPQFSTNQDTQVYPALCVDSDREIYNAVLDKKSDAIIKGGYSDTTTQPTTETSSHETFGQIVHLQGRNQHNEQISDTIQCSEYHDLNNTNSILSENHSNFNSIQCIPNSPVLHKQSNTNSEVPKSLPQTNSIDTKHIIPHSIKTYLPCSASPTDSFPKDISHFNSSSYLNYKQFETMITSNESSTVPLCTTNNKSYPLYQSQLQGNTLSNNYLPTTFHHDSPCRSHILSQKNQSDHQLQSSMISSIPFEKQENTIDGEYSDTKLTHPLTQQSCQKDVESTYDPMLMYGGQIISKGYNEQNHILQDDKQFQSSINHPSIIPQKNQRQLNLASFQPNPLCESPIFHSGNDRPSISRSGRHVSSMDIPNMEFSNTEIHSIESKRH